MAYRLKDYLYNDKLTKEQNILMDRLYKLRMSGMAEAFEKQLLEPNTGLEPFEVRFAAIVNQEWDQRESKKFKRLMKKATLKYPAADLDSSIYDPERQLNTHVIELLAKWSAGGLRARPEPHRRPHPHASDGVREKSPYIISILRAFCTIHARRDTSARLLSARSARPYEPHPSRLACTSSATPKR